MKYLKGLFEFRQQNEESMTRFTVHLERGYSAVDNFTHFYFIFKSITKHKTDYLNFNWNKNYF